MNNINGGHTKTQTDKSTVAPAVGPNPKPSDKSYHSCDTQDTESNLPPFTPNHRPGIYSPITLCRSSKFYDKSSRFIFTFFANEVIETICKHTNNFGSS